MEVGFSSLRPHGKGVASQEASEKGLAGAQVSAARAWL